MNFSYKNLTAMQVKGAGDRARRQVEAAQLTSRHAQIQRKWQEQFLDLRQDNQQGDFCYLDKGSDSKQGSSDKDHFVNLFAEAVTNAFSNELDRELSPFMTARLATLSCQEYKVILANKGMRRLQNDYRVVVNWLYQQLEEQEKDKKRLERTSHDLIEQKKRELREIEERKIEELRESLEYKKRELKRLRAYQQGHRPQHLKPTKQLKLHEHQILDSKHEGKLHPIIKVDDQLKHFSAPAYTDAMDWVDLDDNVEKGGGSDWIVCS